MQGSIRPPCVLIKPMACTCFVDVPVNRPLKFHHYVSLMWLCQNWGQRKIDNSISKMAANPRGQQHKRYRPMIQMRKFIITILHL